MKSMFFALCIMSLFCVPSVRGETTVDDPRIQQAEQLANRLMGQLKQELLAGLKQGPESAVNICRIKAPQISQQLTTPEIKIGRVSHRPRNPENKVQSWQQELLADYLDKKTPQPPRSVLLPDGSLGFVKPIYMGAPCLRCHGENISAQVLQAIEQDYPQDQAQGFKLGEFRGLTWVIIQ